MSNTRRRSPQNPKNGKDADRALNRLQALLLDSVGSLTSILEWQQAGHLTTEAATGARDGSNAHVNVSAATRREEETHNLPLQQGPLLSATVGYSSGQKPRQNRKPQIAFTEKEEEGMQAEIHSMLE